MTTAVDQSRLADFDLRLMVKVEELMEGLHLHLDLGDEMRKYPGCCRFDGGEVGVADRWNR